MIQTMVPKYYALKQDLVEKIEAREFAESGPIPSERELVESYRVSRITVRRAIDELVREGYLYKVQGRGTFVKAEECDQDLVSPTSCAQGILNLGMTPRRKVLSESVVEADVALSSRLELGAGEPVFVLERVYYADDTPVNHTFTHLPHNLFPGIELYDFSQESLYEVLGSGYGVRITDATRRVEAVLAKGRTAENLEVRPGTPILLFKCVTHGEVGGKRMPIETFECYYRSDKFKFYINQIAS